MLSQEMPRYARDPLTSGQSLMILGIPSEVHHLFGVREQVRVSPAAKGVEPETVVRLELGLRVRYSMREIEHPAPSCPCFRNRTYRPGQGRAERCLERHFLHRPERGSDCASIQNKRQPTLALVMQRKLNPERRQMRENIDTRLFITIGRKRPVQRAAYIVDIGLVGSTPVLGR